MPKPLLRRLDQLAIATLTLAATAGVAAWVMMHSLGRDGLVQIERATPLHYEFLVDVNQAEWPELAQLPGIGELLARRIVAARGQGRFRTTEDLMKVKGIGPRKLAQMRRYLLPLPEDEMMAHSRAPSGKGGS